MDLIKSGAIIRTRRKAAGLTQRALADRLHVTDKAVSKWERGLSCPDTALIVPLAELLDISERELLMGGLAADAHTKPESWQWRGAVRPWLVVVGIWVAGSLLLSVLRHVELLQILAAWVGNGGFVEGGGWETWPVADVLQLAFSIGLGILLYRWVARVAPFPHWKRCAGANWLRACAPRLAVAFMLYLLWYVALDGQSHMTTMINDMNVTPQIEGLTQPELVRFFCMSVANHLVITGLCYQWPVFTLLAGYAAYGVGKSMLMARPRPVQEPERVPPTDRGASAAAQDAEKTQPQ